MKTINFKVQGIKCGTCENKIQNAFTAQEIQRISASSIDQSVQVEVDDTNLKSRHIKSRIEGLGFPILEMSIGND